MSRDKDNIVEMDIKENDESYSAPTNAEHSESVETAEAGAASDEKHDAPEEASEREDYYHQLLRVQAEMQNYKRRTEQRLSEWQMNAARDLVKKLLPVVDDFNILFDHHKNEDESISVKGVAMIYNKLLSTLKDMGLKPIEAAGKPFNPNFHEAVMAEATDDVEEGHVLRVWQKGYTFNDTLLRPAKVITAKSKSKATDGGMNE